MTHPLQSPPLSPLSVPQRAGRELIYTDQQTQSNTFVFLVSGLSRDRLSSRNAHAYIILFTHTVQSLTKETYLVWTFLLITCKSINSRCIPTLKYVSLTFPLVTQSSSGVCLSSLHYLFPRRPPTRVPTSLQQTQTTVPIPRLVSLYTQVKN